VPHTLEPLEGLASPLTPSLLPAGHVNQKDQNQTSTNKPHVITQPGITPENKYFVTVTKL
jgi:hypothetical protein